MPEQFINPFPEIAWDRDYQEIPDRQDLPTKDTTVLFDLVEQLILKRPRLFSLVEAGELSLPAIGTGTRSIANAYSVVGEWLLAQRSEDRRRAKKDVDSFMATTEGLQAMTVFVDAQPEATPYKSQINEVNAVLEKTIKAPSYFRIRGVFQLHTVETEEAAEEFRGQLRDEMEQIFKPDENNVLFLEDALGEFYNNQDFYAAYQHYKSLRKAYAYLRYKHEQKLTHSFAQLQRNFSDELDQLVSLNIKLLDMVARPDIHPELAYVWIEMQTVDEFLEKGYPIDILFERGSKDYKLPELTANDAETMPAEQFANILRQRMDIMFGRITPSNIDIAKQLEELEASVDPKTPTNVLMVFGSTHIGAINNLPSRLQQITTIS